MVPGEPEGIDLVDGIGISIEVEVHSTGKAEGIGSDVAIDVGVVVAVPVVVESGVEQVPACVADFGVFVVLYLEGI